MPVINSWKHDPQAKLDYTWPWGSRGWLEDDETITSSTITAPTGVTVTDKVVTPENDVVAWVTVAATVRGTVSIPCHIETSKGRKDDRTLTLIVGNR